MFRLHAVDLHRAHRRNADFGWDLSGKFENDQNGALASQRSRYRPEGKTSLKRQFWGCAFGAEWIHETSRSDATLISGRVGWVSYEPEA